MEEIYKQNNILQCTNLPANSRHPPIVWKARVWKLHWILWIEWNKSVLRINIKWDISRGRWIPMPELHSRMYPFLPRST